MWKKKKKKKKLVTMDNATQKQTSRVFNTPKLLLVSWKITLTVNRRGGID
jgi:hypothetical protein